MTPHPEAYEAGIRFAPKERIADCRFWVSPSCFSSWQRTGLPRGRSLAKRWRMASIKPMKTTFGDLCLETMAGKGSEVGRSFDELARIIANSTRKIGWAFASTPATSTMPEWMKAISIRYLDDFDHAIGLSA
jgi:hypothetical protein